jgi:hypothetical protein
MGDLNDRGPAFVREYLDQLHHPAVAGGGHQPRLLLWIGGRKRQSGLIQGGHYEDEYVKTRMVAGDMHIRTVKTWAESATSIACGLEGAPRAQDIK